MKRFTGAIPLLRKFRDHPFWKEKRRYSRAEAWIDFLYIARYSESAEEILDRGETICICYGQILTSIITLSDRWKRSRTWIRNFIKTLEENESIKIIKMDNRRTIVEIVNMLQVRNLLRHSKQQTGQQDERQKSDKKTYKNKDNTTNKVNIISKDITQSGFGNPDINEVITYFKETLKFPILDGTIEQNRHYAHLCIQKFGGVDKVKLLIDSAKVNQFWATKATSFSKLFYNGVNIISSNRYQKGGVTQL